VGAWSRGSRIVVGVSLLALAASGCSVRKMALRETGELMTEGMGAMNSEPDYELAMAALPANLKTVEILLTSDPENPHLLFILAQGYASYAFVGLQDQIDAADFAGDYEGVTELKRRAAGLYRRAEGFGLRLLGEADFGRMAREGTLDEFRAALGRLEGAQAPGLFWLTFAWASRINLDPSNPALLAGLPKVEAALDRLLVLQPEYYHGLPLLTAGVTAAGRPAMFGGDLPRGLELLERGIAVSKGEFLLGPFLMARYYAVQAQDRDRFCSSLSQVLAADPAVLPEQGLINAVSRRWAKRWQAKAGDLFEGGGPGGCAPPKAPSQPEVEDDDGTLQ